MALAAGGAARGVRLLCIAMGTLGGNGHHSLRGPAAVREPCADLGRTFGEEVPPRGAEATRPPEQQDIQFLRYAPGLPLPLGLEDLAARENCAAAWCGLSRSARRRVRCRVVAARWAQRHAVVVGSALFEQVDPPDLLSDRLGRCEAEMGATLGKLHVLTKDKDDAKKEVIVLRAREHILSAQIDLLKKSPQAFNLPQPTRRKLKKNPSDESSTSCSTRCPDEGLPPVEEAQQSQEPEPNILPKDLLSNLREVGLRNHLLLDKIRGIQQRVRIASPSSADEPTIPRFGMSPADIEGEYSMDWATVSPSDSDSSDLPASSTTKASASSSASPPLPRPSRAAESGRRTAVAASASVILPNGIS